MAVSIIIPCYNEVDNIPILATRLLPVVQEMARTNPVELVLVDDGSTDGTWQAMHDVLGNAWPEGVTVSFQQHARNQGLGAAIRTGFAVATGEIIVTTDSDGTYHFREIPGLLRHLTPDIHIVTASPYHPQGGVDGVPGYRLLLSKGSSMIYRLLVDRHIYCYTALFRAYRREVIENIPFQADGYLAGTEFMVRAMQRGYRVAEYPTVLHQRHFGVSKARIARTIAAHLRFQRQILLDTIRGRKDAASISSQPAWD